jgi:hypothetical protein
MAFRMSKRILTLPKFGELIDHSIVVALDRLRRHHNGRCIAHRACHVFYNSLYCRTEGQAPDTAAMARGRPEKSTRVKESQLPEPEEESSLSEALRLTTLTDTRKTPATNSAVNRGGDTAKTKGPNTLLRKKRGDPTPRRSRTPVAMPREEQVEGGRAACTKNAWQGHLEVKRG